MREYHEQQQNQFKKMQEEQAQLQRDFSNYRKNFSTHMSRTHKSFEEQGKQMEEINTWHTKSHQMYSNWALQQMTLFSLLFYQVGGESSVAPPQQAPPEANAPRRENPDSDDE
ncbi:hypothetical protein PIB30_071527 [Stylosanthes scabra]|uniref:Uncharacterized protein n=1 Tax=Stylosanthes scabra TaxID=79078 RepID=A0ABU6QPG3_9FABA|nr:hypothetical protein [Stylosanthes scabra]